MRKARKRVLSALLAAVLALGLMPSFAFAGEGDEGDAARDPQLVISETQGDGIAMLSARDLPTAVDGVITLEDDVTMSSVYQVSSNQDIVIDLNGHTLAYNGKGGVFLNVMGGSLTIRDSKGTGVVKVDEPYNGTGAEGKTQTIRCVQVHAGATFTLESGTLTNTNTAFEATQVISNYGTVNIEGGEVRGITGIFMFAPELVNELWADKVATCNVSGGEIIGTECRSYRGETGGNYDGWNYGIAIYGPGVADDGSVDNSKAILNISDGIIAAGQGIGTNASSGVWAGYTFNMTGGTVIGTNNATAEDVEADGTGMYLPAIGVNNISGGTVTGAQAIRICAGELNVTGGTISSTALSDGKDLVAGGSGGTLGAIVVGKASSGYVGDITVNVSQNATVENTASKASGTGDVAPAIVVSDKNMSNASFRYDDLSIAVNVNGGTVTGDVVKISNLTGSTTQDGGNTSLEITGGTVTGNVINQTSAGDLNVTGAIVIGDVKNDSKGAVVISGAEIKGSVTTSPGKSGNVAILDSIVTGSAPNDATIVNSTVGNTKHEGTEYVALLNGKGYTSLQDAVNEVTSKEPATITLLKSTAGSGVVVDGKVARNLTFDLGGFTYTVTSGVGSANTETNGFQLIKNNDITFKNGIIAADPAEGEQVKILIQNYSNLTLENVTLDGTGMTNNDSGLNYTLSNNNGEINLNTGATIIPRADDEIAMDVCWASSYENGARVTVNEGATIQGNVELRLWGQTAYDNRSVLTVKGGTITGELKLDKTIGSEKVEETINSLKTNITINGGSFGGSVEKFIDATDKAVAQVRSGNTYSYFTAMDAALAAAQPGDSVTAVNQDDSKTYFILILDYNDGDATADSTYTVESGTEITLPAPTRVGYTFKGWYDANETKAGSTYTVAKNETLTARWSLIPTPVPTPEQFDVAVADVQNGAVELSAKTAKEGQKVTVTVTPDLGWELAQLTVADEDGDALELTENADGTYSFTMPAGDVTVHASFADAWENPFTDLSEDHWGYGAVRTANLLGLMKGIGGTTLFGPDDGLLREQAATVMWNLMGAGDVSRPEAPQADVDQSQWYAPYVNWAVDSKVMDGYSEDDFGVGDSLTREQFAAVVAKAVGADVDSADQAALGAFPDADGVSGWARATMAWAVEAGVLNGVGTEDGSRELQATRELTRAEMATMMVNAIEVGVLDFGA